MVGVGPLLHKQIVNGLVAEARRPGKRVLSQVGQALLMLICLMIIMIIMTSMRLMIIMIIFTLANLIVAVLGRATVLLVGRVEESSSSPHSHVRPCRHYHLQQKLDLASLPKANENIKDLGQLVIAIGDSKV